MTNVRFIECADGMTSWTGYTSPCDFIWAISDKFTKKYDANISAFSLASAVDLIDKVREQPADVVGFICITDCNGELRFSYSADEHQKNRAVRLIGKGYNVHLWQVRTFGDSDIIETARMLPFVVLE